MLKTLARLAFISTLFITSTANAACGPYEIQSTQGGESYCCKRGGMLPHGLQFECRPEDEEPITDNSECPLEGAIRSSTKLWTGTNVCRGANCSGPVEPPYTNTRLRTTFFSCEAVFISQTLTVLKWKTLCYIQTEEIHSCRFKKEHSCPTGYDACGVPTGYNYVTELEPYLLPPNNLNTCNGAPPSLSENHNRLADNLSANNLLNQYYFITEQELMGTTLPAGTAGRLLPDRLNNHHDLPGSDECPPIQP